MSDYLIQPVVTGLVPGTKRTRLQQLADDCKLSAYHEAGHFVVAKHFKPIQVEARIELTEEGPTLTTSGFVGNTWTLPPLPPFRMAVVGWAGALAELLADQTVEEWEINLFDCWELPDDFLSLSPSDEAMIARHYMRWRSFKTAAAIIKKRHAEIEKVARDLQERGFVVWTKGKSPGWYAAHYQPWAWVVKTSFLQLLVSRHLSLAKQLG